MTYEEIQRALDEAKWIMQRTDVIAERSLQFAVGRLNRLDVGVDTLRALKRELRNFDITTGQWK